MSNTRTTKPDLIVVAFILSALLLTALVSGGAGASIPTAGPQPPDRQPFYSPSALSPSAPLDIVPATAAELAAAMDVPAWRPAGCRPDGQRYSRCRCQQRLARLLVPHLRLVFCHPGQRPGSRCFSRKRSRQPFYQNWVV